MRVPVGTRAGVAAICKKKSLVILSNLNSPDIFVSPDRAQLDASVDVDGFPTSGTPIESGDPPTSLTDFQGKLYAISYIPGFLEVEIL